MKYFIGLILLIVAAFWWQNIKTATTRLPTVTIRNHTFTVDVARTDEEKELGLGRRSSLAQNSGMLFLFEAPQALTFWMKGMEFSLDIIFIKDDKIVTIYIYNSIPYLPANAPLSQLPHYTSTVPSNKVLEINAGLSKTYGFQEGDTVEIKGL